MAMLCNKGVAWAVNAIIIDKLPAIHEACKECGVYSLYAFGSVVRSDFRPQSSDIDLVVDFGSMAAPERKRAYFSLHDLLTEAFGGARIDLVMVGTVKNPYIAQNIDESKQLLYAA
jgi:predicted nucleotidyltransferase